jgi:hypothetical protein
MSILSEISSIVAQVSRYRFSLQILKSLPIFNLTIPANIKLYLVRKYTIYWQLACQISYLVKFGGFAYFICSNKSKYIWCLLLWVCSQKHIQIEVCFCTWSLGFRHLHMVEDWPTAGGYRVWLASPPHFSNHVQQDIWHYSFWCAIEPKGSLALQKERWSVSDHVCVVKQLCWMNLWTWATLER